MINRKVPKTILAVVLGIPLLLYCGVVGYYMYAESSIVYHPAPASEDVEDGFKNVAERVAFESSGHVRLVGWVIRAETPTSRWVYFLHSNSGNATSCQSYWKLFHELNVNVFVLDYRGYGESSGTPSEQGLYDDALSGYKYLIEKQKTEKFQVVLYGYSLGSAVAVDLASRAPIAGLIVEGALSSIDARGKELFPFLPVHFMVRNHFDSLDKIGMVTCPILFLHAREDETAPIHHGYALYNRASAPKTFIELEGDHGDGIERNQQRLSDAISDFLRNLPSGA